MNLSTPNVSFLEVTMAYTRRAALASAALIAAACSASAAEVENGLFSHGVASGDPLKDKVIIWTRLSQATTTGTGPIQVDWMVATDAALTRIAKRGRATTNAARDYTVKVDVTGLRSGQTYYYGFKVGTHTSPIGRTQTAPERGGESLKIALVSCSNFPAGWFNVYQAIARRGDVDLVLHVGDYIYEYGAGQYATDWGKTVGRVPDPPHECLTLDDYRRRYAQYRSDPDLQAAHACAPWLVTWDDHETSNDSYKDGAENHNRATEGNWTDRKAAALQAYYEWLPLRDPIPGKAFEAINRSFEWGSLATIAMLETRLLARTQQLDYATDIAPAAFDMSSGAPIKITDPARLASLNPTTLPANVAMLPDLDGFKRQKLNAPGRELLGQGQQAWLQGVLTRSVERGTKWQVLGNQVIMARVTSPDLSKGLPAQVREAIGEARPETRAFFQLSQYDVPFNLDAWDGYPAARERLYDAAKAAGARLVVCTGDTHAAWANTLKDRNGEVRGVEFGGTSVTSPSTADALSGFGLEGTLLNSLIVDKNDEVEWHDETKRGYTLVTLTPTSARGDFMAVDTIKSKTFIVSTGASWQSPYAATPSQLVKI
jgi:alkaline phosphatase D